MRLQTIRAEVSLILLVLQGILLVPLRAADPNMLAFPGAEGFGAFARGGRGGKVYRVTTLADYDPGGEPIIAGSLREAIEAEGPRILKEIRTGTGRIIDPQDEVGGWPELAQGSPLRDTDLDGMPDGGPHSIFKPLSCLFRIAARNGYFESGYN